VRGHDVFLVFEFTEERLCTLTDMNNPWYEIWAVAMARTPELIRTHKYYP